MIVYFATQGSGTVTTLAAGSAAGQPTSGMVARVIRRTDIVIPCAALAKVIPAGGQVLQLVFSVPKTGGVDELKSPALNQLGALKITAPDGAWNILNPAAITSRKATVIGGTTLGWAYTILASAEIHSSSELGGVLVTDGNGAFLIDGNGNFRI